MTQDAFGLDFLENRVRVCTIDEPRSTSVDLPVPLADWLVRIVRRLERQTQTTDDKPVNTDSENA